MNLNELRSFDYPMQLPNKKSSLTSRNMNKVTHLSLTPKPGKSRIVKHNNQIDLTSTALNVSTTPRRVSHTQEIAILQSDLQSTKDLLADTINSYETKLKNAEYIISLLKDEIRGQLREFKNEVLYQKSEQDQVSELNKKINDLQYDYENKVNSIRNEKLCSRCKAFIKVSDDIQSKKKLYDYLY